MYYNINIQTYNCHYNMKSISVMKVFVLNFLVLLVAAQNNVMNKVVLNPKGDALCLDGTPGAYYISEGSGVNKNKFILFFQGGGWCGGTNIANTL